MAQEHRNANEVRIYSIDDCKQYFHDNVSSPNKKMLGLEYELILMDKLTMLHVPYFGERGLNRVLTELLDFGYRVVMDAGCIMGLERKNTSVSLEPGGQLEFSTSPNRTAFGISQQLSRFLSELHPICERLGIAILHTGYRPFGTAKLVDTIPRSRYATLMPHLERFSALSNEQKMTASIQVSLDYHSQAHAGDALLLGSKCQPFIVALFANSPIYNGSISDVKSFRMYTWSKFAPERCGIPGFMFASDFSQNTFSYYTEWAMSKSLLFIVRNDELISVAGITFTEFLLGGYKGHEPQLNDWVVHLGTLFPEARLKNLIEVRSADTCDPKFASGLAAFWKGLLYDGEAMEETLALLQPYSLRDTKYLYRQAYSKGMNGTTREGRAFPELLSILLNIARQGLARGASSDKDLLELEHLRASVKCKQSPADIIISHFSNSDNIVESMVYRGNSVTELNF